jgi:hypothetical protein
MIFVYLGVLEPPPVGPKGLPCCFSVEGWKKLVANADGRWRRQGQV